VTVEVNHSALSQIACRLRATAEDLDDACRTAPVPTGAGEVGQLLADILFTVSATNVRLVEEAVLLSTRTQECADAYSAIDELVAQRLFEIGAAE